MWWDLAKRCTSTKCQKALVSMPFMQALLWMGGVDVNNQLKVAAVRFRTSRV